MSKLRVDVLTPNFCRPDGEALRTYLHIFGVFLWFTSPSLPVDWCFRRTSCTGFATASSSPPTKSRTCRTRSSSPLPESPGECVTPGSLFLLKRLFQEMGGGGWFFSLGLWRFVSFLQCDFPCAVTMFSGGAMPRQHRMKTLSGLFRGSRF